MSNGPINRRSRTSPSREGYLYVAVLFTSLMVAVIVAGSLALSTSKMRQENDRADRLLAIQLAESELQLQSTRMQASTQWRNSLANDQFSGWRELFGGSVRHRYFDSDTSLSDDDFDNVTLTVHARVNNAEVALSIELANAKSPHSCLNYGVTSTEDLRINDSGNITSEMPIQVGDDCTSNSFALLVAPKVEYSDQLTVVVRGDTGASDVVGPPVNLIDLYSTLGTQIDAVAIPQQSGDLVIQDVVISPTSNPYGSTNPNGVYLLDSQGKRVVIRNCRIEGTLVVFNNSSVLVGGAMCWNSLDPARAALISAGSVTFDAMEAVLSEQVRSTNFNPASTPNRGGVSNTSALDTYPTSIRGVVCSLEDIYITPMVGNERLHFYGSLCARQLVVTARVSIFTELGLLSNPPLGFHDPAKMKFVARSMRRVATP